MKVNGSSCGEGLLRPEPKPENGDDSASGVGLFGITLAACALFAIYLSTPVDAPEWPDCPIQTLGSCGSH